MQVAIFILFVGLASVCACDKSELADLTWNRSYFIFAAENIDSLEGTNIESFDLKLFLHLLEFRNTSQTLPLIFHPEDRFLSYKGVKDCGKNSKFEVITQRFTSSPNKSINGILYGCELHYYSLIKIIIHDESRWSEKEIQNKCEKSQEVPAKYVSRMNGCLEEYKNYSKNCLHITIDDEFKGVDMIFGGVLLLISISFAACIVHKYFKSRILSYET